MQKRQLSAPTGAGLVILSSFFYASYGIWTTKMGDAFGGYTAAFFRSLLVLAILVPIAIATRQLSRQRWQGIRRYFMWLVVTAAMVWGPLYYAILHAGVGLALAVNYACIVIGMFLLGRIFAGERFTRDKWLSAGLGLTGIALVFMPNIATLGWLALTAAAMSGFGSAANSIVAKKIPCNATQTSVFVWIASVFANAPMMVIVGEPLPNFGWHMTWFYLLLFSVTSVIATWSFVQGVKLIEAGVAGILGLCEIVFGVLIGVILFQEHPKPLAMFGVGLILLSAAIPYIKDYNARRGILEG